MRFGNDQNVRRCLGIHIFEGDCKIVLMHQLCRYLLCNYFAENAVLFVCHNKSPLFPKRRKKQLRAPVWHAGPVCSTLIRSVS
jgi:hypothetical protein